MLILLTNDDGVHAEGLAALHDRLSSRNDVYVVAPEREQSGSGHAITVFRPLTVRRAWIGRAARHPDAAEAAAAAGERQAWAVMGTPVDCVKLALASLLPRRPDIVISGVNRGPNLGTDVFYSGTVSAAIDAALVGLPSLAVSLAAYGDADYSFAAEVAEYVAGQAVARGLPPSTLLNVNVPGTPEEAVAGIRVTRLSGHKWHDAFEERADPRGHSYFWLAGEPLAGEAEPGTDVEAIRDNCVSVTPVHLDLTHHAIISELEGWRLDLGELRKGLDSGGA